jgi:hypothetical protein
MDSFMHFKPKDSLKSKHCLECFKIGLSWNLIGISFIFSETRYTLMKKDYFFKNPNNDRY